MTDIVDVAVTPEDEPKKKKRINSRKKGSSFEGNIAKTLTEMMSSYGFVFRRSERSGGVLGGSNVKDLMKYAAEVRPMMLGDVVSTNEMDILKKFQDVERLRFVIECKFYRDQPTLSKFLSNTTLINNWFQESVIDAAKIDRQPILIFKFNHTKIFVAFNVDPPPGEIQPGDTGIMTWSGFHIMELDRMLKYPEWWIVKKPLVKAV